MSAAALAASSAQGEEEAARFLAEWLVPDSTA